MDVTADEYLGNLGRYAAFMKRRADLLYRRAIVLRRNGRARVGLGAWMAQHGHPGGVALMQRGLEEERGRPA